jgi:hypothetical protein
MVIDVLERDDLLFPRSLPGFQRLFPDEAACAAYLERARWGDGFNTFRSLLGIAGDVTAPTYAELYAKKSRPPTGSRLGC